MDILSDDTRLLILRAMPDMASLKAVVRSCPIWHACYLRNRKRILFDVLIRELTMPVFIQAIAVFEARSVNIPLLSRSEEYREKESAGIVKYSELSLEKLVRLAKFYHTVKTITNDFLETCLREHPMTREKVDSKELSRTETLRIYRAIYNLELYFTVFEDVNPAANPAIRWSGNCLDKYVQYRQLLYFLRHFSVAETEEMSCIEEYMHSKYLSLFYEIRSNSDLTRRLQRRRRNELRIFVPHAVVNDVEDILIFPDTPSHCSTVLLGLGIELFGTIHKQPNLASKLSLLNQSLTHEITRGTSGNIFMNVLKESINRVYDQEFVGCWVRYMLKYDIGFKREFRMRGSASKQNPTDEQQALALGLPNAKGTWELMQWFTTLRPKQFWKREVWEFRRGLLSWGYAMWDRERLEQLGLAEISHETLPRMGPRHLLKSGLYNFTYQKMSYF
ncbi:hypothetical protein ACMFMF_011493 [Clarireedia jacksonii]